MDQDYPAHGNRCRSSDSRIPVARVSPGERVRLREYVETLAETLEILTSTLPVIPDHGHNFGVYFSPSAYASLSALAEFSSRAAKELAQLLGSAASAPADRD